MSDSISASAAIITYHRQVCTVTCSIIDQSATWAVWPKYTTCSPKTDAQILIYSLSVGICELPGSLKACNLFYCFIDHGTNFHNQCVFKLTQAPNKQLPFQNQVTQYIQLFLFGGKTIQIILAKTCIKDYKSIISKFGHLAIYNKRTRAEIHIGQSRGQSRFLRQNYT